MDSIEVQQTEAIEIEVSPEDHRKTLHYEDGVRLELGGTLGKGSFSKVKRGTEFAPERSSYAVKIMHKGILKRQRSVLYDSQNSMQMTNNLEKVLMEINIWRQLRHPNIVTLHRIVNDPSHEYIYLLIDMCELGQIMNWNMNEQKYELNTGITLALRDKHPALFEKYSEVEATAKVVFRMVAEALNYLHNEKLVLHKDVKPDNILFSNIDFTAKITDFTISQQLQSFNDLCFNPPGTTPFQAPESMFSGTGFVGQKADVWAFGTCVYALMSGGYLPFWDRESEIQTQLAIQNVEPNYLETFSQELVDFLKLTFTKDPEHRPFIDSLLTHPWLNLNT